MSFNLVVYASRHYNILKAKKKSNFLKLFLNNLFITKISKQQNVGDIFILKLGFGAFVGGK